MSRIVRFCFLFLWAGIVTWIGISAPVSQTPNHQSFITRAKPAPRLWNSKALASWPVPIAGVNATPNYYAEAEYYAAPVDNLRTYPVYHPDFEPKGYREHLKQLGAQPLIEPEKIKTEKDWIAAGQRVFDELDVPISRTEDAQVLAFLQDREALKKNHADVTRDGILPGFRWVVTKEGKLQVSLAECSACHVRLMPDGKLLRGAPGNQNLGMPVVNLFLGEFASRLEKEGMGATLQETEYASYGVPWLPHDIHQKLRTMKEEEIAQVDGAPMPGTFARFNGSPYYITKIPDLIGIKDQRYLDHTGTHRNRGPEDIARYGILVTTADDGSIGPYQFKTEAQRKLLFRFSDEAMFALGKYIYSLEYPVNPNKPNDLTAKGKKVFDSQGCMVCHTPPLYTNNALTPVKGFTPSADLRETLNIKPVSVGTDPGLALLTRKGTGYYKVPSLRGLWYRGLVEHSGSIASLEDWFDPKRLRDDYVPSGWKGPGVTTRAVKGHEFGLDLSPADKKALIAFLKTL
ncbi:MAG: hypothetical protein K1Y36_15595 [Blastocatellia bacterium]|nr:hypothetical protein [Blastocatellia bacterium]